MDAHYFQVMKARESIQDTGSRWYFGYSGVLDREAFEEWQTQHSYSFFKLPEGVVAQAKDVDLSFNFPSRWWGGRVAGLIDQKDTVVWGRLYEIPAVDWPVIQHKEGVITGMAVERSITVLVDGKETQATTFTTSPQRASLEGPLSERYINTLIKGAEQAGLPADYVSSLRVKAI